MEWMSWLTAVGGIGLFLFGMLTLTDGLKSIAGPGMQRFLARAASTPWRGAGVGAAMTALIQSSSATTVTAVGLASAGLLTFQQVLGIVVGSAVGTTATGWVVALLGFKLKLGVIAQALVFVGSLLALLGSGWWRRLGMALAGFALIFLGIDVMQSGLEGLQGVVDFSMAPEARVRGLLVMIGIGAVLAAVMQSSSTTLAAALTGVASGVIEPAQACALALGAQIGTSSTALLAGFAAPLAGRRTAAAHFSHAMFSSMVGLVLLPLYLGGVHRFAPGWLESDPTVVVVVFHTGFNVVSAALMLSCVRYFGRWVLFLVPDRGARRVFDSELAKNPEALILAVGSQLGREASGLAGDLVKRLDKPGPPDPQALQSAMEVVEAARKLLSRVQLADTGREVSSAVGEGWRACDRVQRLCDRLRDERRLRMLATLPRLSREAARLRDGAELCERLWIPPFHREDRRLVESLQELEADGDRLRDELLASVAGGGGLNRELPDLLDALRWMRRTSGHLAAVEHSLHLLAGGVESGERA